MTQNVPLNRGGVGVAHKGSALESGYVGPSKIQLLPDPHKFS
jgi:hypothetical protein